MRICWILIGLLALFRISKSLCVYNAYDPKAVTIVVNCTIPVLVALLLSLMNELKCLVESLTKEDE